MQLIGLTGGIAAGKSTVAARLRDLGAHVIDADRVAREVVEPGTTALEQIEERFGASVVAGGELDRAALGAIVFADDGARRDLEAITHPAVQQTTRDRIAAIAESEPDAVIVYDVPLLVEAAASTPFDLVVVAHANAATRLARLVELRGMSEADAARRVASQATDEQRLARADVVIDTGGSLESTIEQTDALWARIGSEQA